MQLSKIKNWFFDCDGVLLDSNKIKTDGFYEIALPYGTDVALKLRDYHTAHGGISRFHKMKYFITDILKEKLHEKLLNDLVNAYGNFCYSKMLEAEETPGLRDLLAKLYKNTNCFVVSGGSEAELKDIFAARKLSKYFNGIFGSPRDKMQIISELFSDNKAEIPAVFIGDSKYDYVVAENFKLKFVFMQQFTEFNDWENFFKSKDVQIINNLKELID